MRIFSCAILILLLCSAAVKSQSFHPERNQAYRTYRFAEPEKQGEWGLEIKNLNFFQNNEYFTPLNRGYTLTGSLVEPSFYYQPGERARIRLGLNYLLYSGEPSPDKVRPVVSMEVAFPHMHLVMGELYGNIYHNLPEPMFCFDRVFYDHSETGIQLILDGWGIHNDTWINWENFILWGDREQERFTFGNSGYWSVLDETAGPKFKLLFHTLITHRGGQINITDDPIQTLLNHATGLEMIQFFGEEGKMKHAGIRGSLFHYADLSPEKELPANEGYGIYGQAFLFWQNLGIDLGYWYARSFIPLRGEPLFGSYSFYDPGYFERERQLFTGKVKYNIDLMEQLNLILRMDGYFDPVDSSMDYGFGIYLIYHDMFKITKFDR